MWSLCRGPRHGEPMRRRSEAPCANSSPPWASREPRPRSERTAAVRAAVALGRWYQRYLAPLKPPCCRFVPSCSEYAIQAVERHGLLRGTRLALFRLLRCHPLHPGGEDPVP